LISGTVKESMAVRSIDEMKSEGKAMLEHLWLAVNVNRLRAYIDFNGRSARKRSVVCVVILLCVGAQAQAPAAKAPAPQMATSAPIRFEEIAARSGIDFSIDSSPTLNKNQIETMVAGVALIDYDGDGYQDIFFANGAAIPSLKKEGPQYKNRLYHNNGDGTFTDVTEKAGVGGDGYDMGFVRGWGDEKPSLPQQRRRHIQRCHRQSRRWRGHVRREENVVRCRGLGGLQQ
jgi:hypothetical protein